MEVVHQAESEGWDLTRTTTTCLTALRGSRQPGVPSIHGGGGGRHNLSVAVIQAALLGRTDLGVQGTPATYITRSGMLNQGEWGMYWDVYMDVGAALRRRICTVRITIS